MDHKPNKNNEVKMLMIPVVIVNGIIGGVVSVITSYFFKPIWHKIVGYWDKPNE